MQSVSTKNEANFNFQFYGFRYFQQFIINIVKSKKQVLTTTIEGQYLRQIIDGTQTVEHRDVKPYWDERLAKYETPFWLRLINGMRKDAPEATVKVTKVVKYQSKGQYWLYLGEIKNKKNLKNLIKSSDI